MTNPNSNKTSKKLTVSLGLILASIGYAFYQNNLPVSSVTAVENNSPISSAVAVQNTLTTGVLPTTPVKITTPNTPKTTVPVVNVPTPTPVTPTPTPVVVVSTPTPAPVPVPKPAGKYLDGSYTGSAADAYYGMIQVKAIIQNGALADVQFLQYPSDRGTSVRINTRAMPILKQEAISAQSASVNIVSGATDSSQAFQQSLASALSQAKNV